MKYLNLAADYQDLALGDEESGPITIDDLGLSAELVDDLVEWNERYQSVIPKSMDERYVDEVASLIDELDRAGLALAERVASEVAGGAKVRYYSEGLLRPLP